MTDKKKQTKFWLDEEDKKMLMRLAEQANVSQSEIVRRLLRGESEDSSVLERSQQFEDLLDAIQVLRHTQADLARLGNLMKLALDDDHWADSEAEVNSVGRLIAELAHKKDVLQSSLDQFKALALAISGKTAGRV